MYSGAEQGIFFGRQSCGTNIFIKTTPNTHLYIHTVVFYLFIIHIHIYIHFLFDKFFIYTHPKKKKKSLVFSIKIIFDGNLSKK